MVYSFYKFATFTFTCLLIFSSQIVCAQQRSQEIVEDKDPRGEVDLIVCSQNLNNYGTPAATRSRNGLSANGFEEKENAIARRIVKAKCDVVAVQEVLSKNEEEGRKVLDSLARVIRKYNGRQFEGVVGSSTDPNIRNGFLVASDVAVISNMLSYSKVELPKISADQKPRLFGRAPFEIQIVTKSKEEGKSKTLSLINIHFKSKSGAAGDPTSLEWETYRMEMAEALRRVIEDRHRPALKSAEAPLIILGDRNANFDLASALILQGIYALKDFQKDGPCRLSKRGVPLCKTDTHSPAILFSALTSDPVVKQTTGTFHYKGVYSWIDDILLPADTLRLAWKNFDVAGKYDSGVIFEPEEGSDHALVYVKLNW